MSAVVDTDRGRRSDLAAIHIAKGSLGWDDDTYRDILWTVCNVRSSAALDFAGRKRFLDHLRACQKQIGISSAVAPRRAPWTAQQRLAWSMWQQLADAGLVRNRGRKSLDGWVKRQTGVDRLEWLKPGQLDLVLVSLRQWLSRRDLPAG